MLPNYSYLRAKSSNLSKKYFDWKKWVGAHKSVHWDRLLIGILKRMDAPTHVIDALHVIRNNYFAREIYLVMDS